VLPQVKSSSEVYGTLRTRGQGCGIAGILAISKRTGWASVIPPGEVKIVRHWLLLADEHRRASRSRNRIADNRCVQIRKRLDYALEGSVAITGDSFQWLRDNLANRKSPDVEALAQLSRTTAASICPASLDYMRRTGKNLRGVSPASRVTRTRAIRARPFGGDGVSDA